MRARPRLAARAGRAAGGRARARARCPRSAPSRRASRAQRERLRAQRRARADRDGVRGARQASTNSGSRRGDSEPAALPGRVAGASRRARRARSVARRGSRRARAEAAVALEEASRRVPARKHRSCESRLRATASPARARRLAHLRLCMPPEREAQPGERGRGERRQHVALVLALVGGRPQRRPSAAGDARVVTGRERGGAQPLGEVEHRVEPHAAVAAHARVRRRAGSVAREPGSTTPARNSARRSIERCGMAEAVCQRARAAHRLRRAAAELAVALADRTTARASPRPLAAAPRQQRGDGAVDAAAHRDERAARRAARALAPARTAAPSARCSASAASSAAWRLAGARPPSSLRRSGRESILAGASSSVPPSSA